MGADGEAVRLVAQALQEIEHGISRLEAEGLAPRHEEALAPGVAVRPLGDADQRHIVDAEFGEDLQRRAQLPGAAVDQHQIRPGARARAPGSSFSAREKRRVSTSRIIA